MSLILDALRKAEKDRALGKVPTLEDVTAAPMPTRRVRDHFPPRTLALLALVLGLLALTAWVWPRPPAATTPAAAAPASTPAPAEPAPASSRPAPEAETATEDEQAPAAESEVDPALDEDVVAESIEDLLEPEDEGAALSAADPAFEDELASPDAAEDLALQDASEPAAQPSEASAVDGVPLLRDMPSDYRGAFPPLRVDVHVYDADPARRWVMLNGNKAVEGSTLGEGPRVVEIRPDGMLLEWRGRPVLFPLNR